MDTRRTFSFPSYYDPRYINFSDLYTINDDRVQCQWQVPWHEHRNWEIFGYIVEGRCRHIDSLGNAHDHPQGTVQRMSAGQGISHTEGNPDPTPNRYLQIWIKTDPQLENQPPEYGYITLTPEDKLNKFVDVTQHLPIKQRARFLAGIFTKAVTYPIDSSRCYYVYVVAGQGVLNGVHAVVEGDGLGLVNEQELRVESAQDLELIVIDLR